MKKQNLSSSHSVGCRFVSVLLLLLSLAVPTSVIKAQTPQHEVSISLSSISIAEGNSDNSIVATVTVSISNTPTFLSQVFLCFTGTATEGTDYTLVASNTTNRITFLSSTNSNCTGGGNLSHILTSSSSSWQFRIQANGDRTIENNETIIISIVSTSAATLEDQNKIGISSTAGSVTFTIEDDDSPTANFAAASSTADEDNGTVTIAVNLSKNAIMNTDVAYSVSGTAASATDFSALSNTVQITSGTKTANISIPIIDDEADEPNETIVLTLSDSFGYKVGSPNVHTLTINDDDATPMITSLATASVAENTNSVLTVTATDEDAGTTLTYSITAGIDSARFNIDPSTGALTFKTAPDFETPGDQGGDNVYEVIVTASDGTNSVMQTITVTITDVNEAPVIVAQTFSVTENTAAGTTVGTVAATDEDAGDNLTFSITAGNVGNAFVINENTGVITVAGTIDHETTPIYTLTLQVSDGDLSASAAFTVNVTNVNDNSPMITSSATASIVEGIAEVLTVTATDADAGTILTYSVSEGADQALFSINRTSGALTFITAPDFENPTDQDGDNSYELAVTASDGTNNAMQTITITVTNDPSDDILGFSEAEEALIFPNPSGDYLEVRSPVRGMFQLLSLSGKPLLKGSTNKRIDITSLQSGLYWVQLPDGRLLKFVRE